MYPLIQPLQNTEHSQILIQWSQHKQSSFHSIWLRDHCRCEECGNPAIGRRQLRLSEIDLNVKIIHSDILDQRLNVSWSDGHQGQFKLEWLIENSYNERYRSSRSLRPVLWNEEYRSNPPTFDYEDVLGDDSIFLNLLNTVKDFGLCFINGATAEPGTAEKVASKIGFLQESNYGRVMDLIADKRHRSIANDVQALKPHTDEPYRASPPGILLFHCVETDNNGQGSSTFVDGFEAAQTLKDRDAEGFHALTRHNQGFRRYFDGDVDLVAEFPVISTNEFDQICGVRVNDRVAAPLCIDPESVPVYYRGMQQFLQLTEDENRMVKKTLKPGDIAIFDNHRVLHGRTSLTFKGRRWLQWVQVERGDFHSTMRILSDKLGVERNAQPFLRGAYG